MSRFSTYWNAPAAFAVVWLCVGSLHAAPTTAELLPQTTKACVVVTSVTQLRENWEKTQLGQLCNDPSMKPFVEDIRQQLKDRFSRTGVRLGLSYSDVREVCTGHFCLAAIQPDGVASRHALVVLADISGHEAAHQKLREKVQASLTGQGATHATRTVSDTELTIYQISAKGKGNTTETHEVVIFVRDGQLVACDDEKTALAILERFGSATPAADSLAQLKSYQQVVQHCSEAAGSLQPLVHWFVEPLGYARVMRAAAGGRKRRGTDYLKVLENQGFGAVQAVGGYVNLMTESHEILHRTFVYAPAVEAVPGEKNASGDTDKYRLAARMLNFPNATDAAAMHPQNWIPRQLSTYLTFNCKLQNAFDYSETLVDEVAGDRGLFRATLDGLRTDPSGPQIDIRNEIVAHLGERATMFSVQELPANTQSERLVLAIELINADAVAQSLNRMMESDPDAQKREVSGKTIWEIVSEPEEETPAVVIDGLGPPGLPAAAADEEEEEERKLLENAALAVLNGHLMVASNVDSLVRLIESPPAEGDRLADAEDYLTISQSLTDLGCDQHSMRFFTRTDEEHRTTYELIRQGKMPEGETLLARILNRLMGPEEKGVLRQQQIDGHQLPEYQVVRRYLGPAGMFLSSHDDGWMLTGCLLTKNEPTDETVPALSTASAE